MMYDDDKGYYYPVEVRTDGALLGAFSFIAIIAVPAFAYFLWAELVEYIYSVPALAWLADHAIAAASWVWSLFF